MALKHGHRTLSKSNRNFRGWLLEPSPALEGDELRQNSRLLSGLLLGLATATLVVAVYILVTNSPYLMLFVCTASIFPRISGNRYF